jgi:hypothetical protein
VPARSAPERGVAVLPALRTAPLNRGELRGSFRLSVLRGVNYWRGAALVNGAGTGLVEIVLDRPKWVHLGPLRAPMRQLIVSAEDQSGLATALNRL